MAGWGPAAQHRGSVPWTLGRSRHGIAAARERDGVRGGVEVRVMILDVVYILCLLGWTKFGIGLFSVPDGLGTALLHCIFYILKNSKRIHVSYCFKNVVLPYPYLLDIDTRICIHAG
jgi:hypothetical protein